MSAKAESIRQGQDQYLEGQGAEKRAIAGFTHPSCGRTG